MTDKDRYIIYQMFVFIMRALLLLLFEGKGPNRHANKQDLRDRYSEFCGALDDSKSWDWLRYQHDPS